MGTRKNKKGDLRLEKEIIRKLGEPNFNYSFLSPVIRGYIKYTDLLNGSLTLFDIHKMNEAITYLAQVDNIVTDFNSRKDGSKIR